MVPGNQCHLPGFLCYPGPVLDVLSPHLDQFVPKSLFHVTSSLNQLIPCASAFLTFLISRDMFCLAGVCQAAWDLPGCHDPVYPVISSVVSFSSRTLLQLTCSISSSAVTSFLPLFTDLILVIVPVIPWDLSLLAPAPEWCHSPPLNPSAPCFILVVSF